MKTKVLKNIFDLLFPITCFFCHKNGSYLCNSCEQKLFQPFIKKHCHLCHGLLRTPKIFIHKPCSKRTYLDGLFSTYILNEPLKEYIGQIKYQFDRQMLGSIKLPIRASLANRTFAYDLITFVPLHHYRQRWRGFNQSEDIAKTIDPRTVSLLNKINNTRAQSLLNKIKRKSNVKDCFKCPYPDLVIGKSILICDDVYTTGSTLNSCAKELKMAGAKTVYGYCLAIDEMPADCPEK